MPSVEYIIYVKTKQLEGDSSEILRVGFFTKWWNTWAGKRTMEKDIFQLLLNGNVNEYIQFVTGLV